MKPPRHRDLRKQRKNKALRWAQAEPGAKDVCNECYEQPCEGCPDVVAFTPKTEPGRCPIAPETDQSTEGDSNGTV